MHHAHRGVVFFYPSTMNLIDRIKNIPQSIRDYVQSEKELLRMKMVKAASAAAGNLLAAIFIIIFLNIFFAIVGVTLGLWWGYLLENYIQGFALSALLFLVLLILIVVFRKPLLINPIINAAVGGMISKDKLPEDEKDEYEKP